MGNLSALACGAMGIRATGLCGVLFGFKGVARRLFVKCRPPFLQPVGRVSAVCTPPLRHLNSDSDDA